MASEKAKEIFEAMVEEDLLDDRREYDEEDLMDAYPELDVYEAADLYNLIQEATR